MKSKKSVVFVLAFLVVILFTTLSLSIRFFPPINKITETYPSPFPSPILPLTLDGIFSKNENRLSPIAADLTVTLIATGDIIPARSVNYQATSRNDFLWAFRNTADFLKSSDLTIINLESPLTKNCTVTQTGMSFCGDIRHIQGLLSSGVDIANIANNHAGNMGKEGLNQTVSLLKSNNIAVSGDGSILYMKIKGIGFSFLGYNDIEKNGNPSPATDEMIVKQVKEARSNSEVVIVSFSWGDEYTSSPNNRQIQLGHLAVDAGADLIIGNHPHWVQPVEIYNGALVAYAHGNFIFDQMWSEKTKEGVIGKYTFSGKNLVSAEFIPVKIRNYGEVYFPGKDESDRILNEMKQQSFILEKRYAE